MRWSASCVVGVGTAVFLCGFVSGMESIFSPEPLNHVSWYDSNLGISVKTRADIMV